MLVSVYNAQQRRVVTFDPDLADTFMCQRCGDVHYGKRAHPNGSPRLLCELCRLLVRQEMQETIAVLHEVDLLSAATG